MPIMTSMLKKILLLFALMIIAQPASAQIVIRDTEIENIFTEWTTPLLKTSEIGENSIRIMREA